ncbi:KpsF/GutQ family sugar-phosphate isomerase, partial [Clostridium perfringens]
LAQASDLVINFPGTPEALEFDAPTTSTTMMLAFGDALALTLLEVKGFSRKDFQVFHPGGRLGASFIRVNDLMHQKEQLPFATSDESMQQVIE